MAWDKTSLKTFLKLNWKRKNTLLCIWEAA